MNGIDMANIHEFGFVDTRDIEFHPEFRRYCEDNVCGQYDTSWACPPGVGSVEDCKQLCLEYDSMLLFTSLFQCEDWRDKERTLAISAEFKQKVRLLDKEFGKHIVTHQTLATGGCNICEECTYPDAPCRFPDRVIRALSGFCFNISELAGQAGIKYNNGDDTITLFGAILYNRE